MKLYNTLTRKKEEFKSIEAGKVMVYACGPTVYNYIHLGNARPLCVFDVMRRFLEYKGYQVKYVQNFTDVDDKIINKAISEHTDFMNVANKYIKEFEIDSKGLNVMPATVHPKATENIDEIIKSIEGIIEKGFGYSLENGDVYFRTRKFKDYGKLSRQTLDDLQAGARIHVDESKEDPLDFALWKASKPGEPFWESPWGNGRPGWHIECSSMARKYLAVTIDIHCGGQDLIFPHHENEIAQSECLSGQTFANYWLHNGYINIDNQKMSKSANNFFTVREIAKEHGYEPIRYLMISSHYRSPINYSEEILAQCEAAITRLYNFKNNLKFALEKADIKSDVCSFDFDHYKKKFINAMDDDLNTADAIGVVFEFIKDVNTQVLSSSEYSRETIEKIAALFEEFTNVLGLMYEKGNSSPIEEEIKKLISDREQARREKNWKLADEIRDELNRKGVVIEDTPQGTKFSLK